jgi:hypothetical protein
MGFISKVIGTILILGIVYGIWGAVRAIGWMKAPGILIAIVCSGLLWLLKAYQNQRSN